jgi:hypothetical protein
MTELIDVAPTAWAAAGLHPPAGVRGVSLWQTLGQTPGGAAHTTRDFAFSQGALRLLSIRSDAGRLEASGLSADNPWAPAVLAAAPIDGLSLRLTGDATAAEDLRTALVSTLAGLESPPRAQR